MSIFETGYSLCRCTIAINRTGNRQALIKEKICDADVTASPKWEERSHLNLLDLIKRNLVASPFVLP